MKFLKNMVVLIFLLTSLNAFADDRPPFPWSICEISMAKMYGVWQALSSDGEPLFYLDIRLVAAPEESDNNIISISQYNVDYIKIYSGVGFLSTDRTSLTAGMIGQIIDRESYWIFITTYCDKETNKRMTMAQLKTASGNIIVNLKLKRVHDIKKEIPDCDGHSRNSVQQRR